MQNYIIINEAEHKMLHYTFEWALWFGSADIRHTTIKQDVTLHPGQQQH